MPIYLSSSGYGYTYKKDVQKKSKKNFNKIIKGFFIIILTTIVVFSGVAISNFIKNKINKDDNLFLYALKLNSIESYGQANQTSLFVKNNGGAGNIKMHNGKFYVYLSCYKTKQDAEKVMQNLNENGYQLEIETIKNSFKSVKFNDKNKDLSYNKAINLFNNTYYLLYDLSILIDTNAVNMEQYVVKLNDIINNNYQIIKNFEQNFKNESSTFFVYLKLYLNNMQDLLNNLKLTNTNTSSAVKETYINIIFLMNKLQQNN